MAPKPRDRRGLPIGDERRCLSGGLRGQAATRVWAAMAGMPTSPPGTQGPRLARLGSSKAGKRPGGQDSHLTAGEDRAVMNRLWPITVGSPDAWAAGLEHPCRHAHTACPQPGGDLQLGQVPARQGLAAVVRRPASGRKAATPVRAAALVPARPLPLPPPSPVALSAWKPAVRRFP